MPISFRPMTEGDIPMFREWLSRPHVAEWWDRREALMSVEDLRDSYLPPVPARSDATPYIAMLDGKPIGYAQSYVAMGAGDGWWKEESDPGVRGIDQFLCDGESLGKGLGTRMVKALVSELFRDPAVTRVQTDPAPGNARAIRCYEKAGFRGVKRIGTPHGDALYMIIDRPWIFGYGSLMWDGWENAFGCVRREVADLPGYRRAFDKPSVRRWGAPSAPGATLRLVAEPGAACRGMAFAFPIEARDAVVEYLAEREGADLPLCEHTVGLVEGRTRVTALVATYQGAEALRCKDIEELAAMVCRAEGSGGRCRDYVREIAGQLAALSIDDPAVSELWAAVRRREVA